MRVKEMLRSFGEKAGHQSRGAVSGARAADAGIASMSNASATRAIRRIAFTVALSDNENVMAAFALLLALVHVSIAGPSHTPKVDTHWNYTVRVTSGGKPVHALLTEQIIDPIGGRHPVQFGPTTKNITRHPIDGVFRDYIIWPAEARGITLKLHVIVKVGTRTYTRNYAVVPRG